MNETTAVMVFAGVMSVATVVWLMGLFFALRIGRAPDNRDWQAQEFPIYGHASGETICSASQDELLQRLPKLWKRQTLGILSSTFAVEEMTDRELSVVRLGPVMCNLPTALYFSRVRFRMDPKSQKECAVQYTIDQSQVMNLLRRISLMIVFLIALPTIIGIGLSLWFFVVNNPNPTIRGQVFQTVQVVHVLWPPFMFIGIAAAARRSCKQFVERVLMLASDAELANNPASTALGLGHPVTMNRSSMNQSW